MGATILSNSGGCATDVAVTTLGGGNALIHTNPDNGLFALVGLYAAVPGAGAPATIGTPAIVVQGEAVNLQRLGRIAYGDRAAELLWIPPPTPIGSAEPLVFSWWLPFNNYAYAHAMLVGVSGMGSSPLRAYGQSHGPGVEYAVTLQGTNPHNSVLAYLIGALDANLTPDWCGSGEFPIHFLPRLASPGHTSISGPIAAGIGAPDWLLTAWEIG